MKKTISAFCTLIMGCFIAAVTACGSGSGGSSADWENWPPDSVWKTYGLTGLPQPAAGEFAGAWKINDHNGINAKWKSMPETAFTNYKSALEVQFPQLTFNASGDAYNEYKQYVDMYSAVYKYNNAPYTLTISWVRQNYITSTGTTVPRNGAELTVKAAFDTNEWPWPELWTRFGLTNIQPPTGGTVEKAEADNSGIQVITFSGITSTDFDTYRATLETDYSFLFEPPVVVGPSKTYLGPYTNSNDGSSWLITFTFFEDDSELLMMVSKN
ncbi:hypothetical protein [Breznakiella homolactica]|uniref:Uncharacterized protein n=1 Tax=Breznakiella homolactica TaxID=2798577 RepID=A0A7T7XPR3_9SPIR|nr:hypothetical protein [Breznakiella homolactica]QQO10261.1 hypothetical protein JFL75_04900 [Breznakiella homolactica]